MLFASLSSANSTAVGLMAQGRHEAAIEILFRALQTMRESMEDLPTVCDSHPGPLLPFRTADIAVNFDSEQGVYSRAFFVKFNEMSSVESCGLVLLYHLALAIQCVGIQSGSSPHLKKALGLYRSAHKLTKVVLRSNDGIRLSPVIAAIIFNQTWISNELFETNMAKSLRVMLDCAVGRCISFRLLDDADQKFYCSHMVLRGSEDSRHAAAA